MTAQTHTAAEATAYEKLMNRLLSEDKQYESDLAEQTAARDRRIHLAKKKFEDVSKKLNERHEHVTSICSTTAEFAAHAEASEIQPPSPVPYEECDRIEAERLATETEWNDACRDHNQLHALTKFDEATLSSYKTNRVFRIVAIAMPAVVSAAILIRALLLPVGG